MFAYQPTLNTLELKKDKCIDYVQREYVILNLSHFILLPYIKLSGYKTGIKFDTNPLAVEQNN